MNISEGYCAILWGRWAEAGEVPMDIEMLGAMVREICYYNAKTISVFSNKCRGMAGYPKVNFKK